MIFVFACPVAGKIRDGGDWVNKQPVQAVILAGGKGKRLYPYTLVIPKPLVPLGNMPILELVIRQLSAHQFKSINICTGFLADYIQAIMGDGSKWGVNIQYSHEDKPLSTIGPLTKIENLNDTFIVMNGDLLTDISFSDMLAFHHRCGGIATIATYKKHVQLSLGVMKKQEGSNPPRINGFVEKPTYDFDVSMGIYIFQKRVMEYVPPDTFYGFDHLMYDLLDAGEQINAFEFEGSWIDMGTHEELDRASEEFQANPEKYLPSR